MTRTEISLEAFIKEEKKGYIFSIILAIIGVGFGMIPYICISEIILNLIENMNSFKTYVILFSISMIAYGVKYTCTGISTSLSHEATFRVLDKLRNYIAEKLTKVPMGYVIDNSSGMFKSLFVERVEQLEVPLAHAVPEVASNILVPIAIIIYIFTLNWKMGIASVLTIPFGIGSYSMIMNTFSEKYKNIIDIRNNMSSTVVEYINGIEVVKTFGQGENSYSKFVNVVKKNTKANIKWLKSTQKYTSFMMNLVSSMVFTLPIGCYLYSIGELSLADFLFSLILSLGITGPLLSAVIYTDNLAKIKMIMKEINDILNVDELVGVNSIKKTILNYDVEFKNVDFQYIEGQNILNELSFNIKQGEKAAIVGPSGSGKSTVVKLINRFWDPQVGSISIGGVNIKDIPIAQLTNVISYVSQDNYLFNRSIMENLKLGNENIEDNLVIDACKRANCHDFIMEFEQGYQTVVGKEGNLLSGGQKQRITIARAMLKNSPIVILDEATAYVDPENETLIQSAITDLTKDKTLIVIAHRLNTIVNSDQIILLENGKLVSSGTHEELLRSSKLYRNMWKANNYEN